MPRDAGRLARATLDGLSAHVAIVNKEGVIETVNKRWRDFSVANGPVRGNVCAGAHYLDVCDAARGDDRESARAFAQAIREVLAGRRDRFQAEYPCHSPDQQRWFIGSISRMPGKGPPRAIVLHTDITERKLAQESLRQSETKFRRLYESMRDALVITDMAGHIQEFNAAFEHLLGYSEAELRKLTYLDITPERWHKFEAQVIREQLLPRSYTDVYEKEYRRKDGTLFPVELRTFLIRDEAGPPVAMWAIVRDITQRKDAEERESSQQAAISHLSRVVTIGELAAGIAHEINQPLGASLLYAETCRDLLSTGSPDLAKLARALVSLVVQLERARATVTRLRKILRKKPISNSTVDVNQVMRETAVLLGHRIKHAHVSLVLELDPRIGKIIADSVLIQQVIINLVLNALEAMAATDDRPRQLTLSTTGAVDGSCTITVGDTGPGVAPAIAKRLFESFVTTKPEGMGLGLSISRSIVQRHAGRIWYEPASGGGALFKFTLPARPSDPEGGPL